MALKLKVTRPGRKTSCCVIQFLSFLTVTAFAGNLMAAQVTLSNLSQKFTGGQKSVTVATIPPDLEVTVTYAGSTTPPTNLGTYPVVATVADAVETGSATGTLVIAKGDQSITISGLGAKTYGDAPFTVTATANSGLPVTQWQSSDPAVASVSPSGLVTVVGAGQTSIIASNNGSTNYNAAWLALPLDVARSLVPLPFGTRTEVYNTTTQGLDTASLPSGQATEITYRETSIPDATGTPQVVFQNGPDTLDLSYLSAGLQAVGYWGMAKYINLGGTARKLEFCDVTLVSWAGYFGGRDNNSSYRYKEWADLQPPELVVHPAPGISIPGNSGGYFYPITLSFYEFENEGEAENYRLLTSQTVQAFIPWRPSTGADGITPYPNNGYAFRVPFSFPDGVILPQQVWVAISFNTQSYGTAPTKADGPYNALNVARPATPPTGQAVGSTLLTSTLLFKDWRWQSAAGSTGPMLRLRATPTNATLASPADAGTYEVKTQPASGGGDGKSISLLVINKAPLGINLTNLTQIRDGTVPKHVGVSTTPGDIATRVTYAESPTAPFALGTYPVSATSANPNYEGRANSTLKIGDSFASWQTAIFSGSGLPPDKTTGLADPDGDGLNNFLEYAFNLDPVKGDGCRSTGIETATNSLFFTYRRNLHALDLDYSIQHSTTLANPIAWGLVTPLGENTVSDDGSTKVIRATLAAPAGQSSYFLRLKIQR